MRPVAPSDGQAAVVMTAGAGFAQSPSAGGFEAQLNEARSVGMSDVSRETRSTVATHLSIAEGLYAQGDVAQAEPYLRLARGLMGLDTPALSAATQVGEGTGARSAIN